MQNDQRVLLKSSIEIAEVAGRQASLVITVGPRFTHSGGTQYFAVSLFFKVSFYAIICGSYKDLHDHYLDIR